ncbi:MAG: ATP-binding protein [Burkholderiales bacterium]
MNVEPQPRSVPENDAVFCQVRREMLQTALIEARDGGISLVFTSVILGWVAWAHGQTTAGAIVLAVALAVAGWRFAMYRRLGKGELTPQQLERGEREFEGGALLTSMMGTVAAANIYPLTSGQSAILVIAAICAMLAVATLFVVLVGRAFQYYVVPQLTALMAVSVFDPRVYSPVFAVAVPVFYLTLRRAARRHRAASELSIRRRIATDAANAAKTQFLANMSHEIRTPMNGVLGALDLLGHSELTPAQRHLLETATSSGEALLTVLNEVLDFAKIEAGKLEVIREPLAIRSVLLSVANLFSPLAQRKGLTLATNFDPTLPARVRGDAAHLRQVLLNLVGNAIKFTERGSIVIRARRGAGGNDAHPLVVFEVEDTGIGIAPEIVPRLFTPFFQADQSNQRRFGGTGLGLVISKRIAEAMGGELSVVSTPGRGSTFRLSLALEALASPHESAAAAAATGAPLGLAGKVLLVEDNAVNRMLMGAMLKKLGLEVIEAENGEIALQQLQRMSVDLVLMDCQMPVRDGFSATREIRERERLALAPHIPVVAVTANALSGDADRCFQAGMDAYLAKPFTLDQLREAVAPWLKSN